MLWHGQRIGFEFKFGDAPGITKSMRIAMADLKLARLFVVVPGAGSYNLDPKVERLSILDLGERLGNLREESGT